MLFVVRWQRTKGAVTRTASEMSVESVRDAWDKACDFTDAIHPIKGESSTPMYELLQKLDPNAPGRPTRIVKSKTSGSSGINPVSLIFNICFVVVRWERTEGAVARTEKGMSIESVRDIWNKASDFTNSTYPETIGESSAPVYELLQDLDQNAPGRSRKVGPNKTSGSSGINPVSVN